MVDWRSWINNYIISVIIEAVKEKSTMFQATAGAQPLVPRRISSAAGKKARQAGTSQMGVKLSEGEARMLYLQGGQGVLRLRMIREGLPEEMAPGKEESTQDNRQEKEWVQRPQLCKKG